LDQRTPRHEKIRFRRGDIARLDALPSAAGQAEWTTPPSAGKRALRLAAKVATIAFTLVLIGGVAIYLLGTYGLGSESVRQQAEAAIERALGMDVDASFGPARISLARSSLIAVEVNDVSVREAARGAPLIKAGSLRFGLRFLPLLSGRLELGSVELQDARIATQQSSSERDFLAGMRNADGLVDPDRVSAAIFSAMHVLLDRLSRGTSTVDLSGVEIALPHDPDRPIRIEEASLSSVAGELTLTGSVTVGGRRLDLAALARRNETSRRITELDVTVTLAAPAAATVDPADDAEAPPTSLGAAELRFTGAEGIGGEAAQLAIALKADDVVIRMNKRAAIGGNISLAATQRAGTGEVAIERLRVLAGRSQIELEGKVGLGGAPAGEGASYRYELVSERSTVAPDDSPEQALPLVARASGGFVAAAERLTIDDFAVRTAGGEAFGMADFTFADDTSPAMNITLSVPSMPVAHVKQLWPRFTAIGARRWVLANVFGGQIRESSLQLRLGPGRATDGIPLNAQEVFGHVNVENARFDTTGEMPPVRDAIGTVDFAGGDVDIALATGRSYLPSGRVVTATNGKLAIRKVTQQPVIGELDMDIQGDAEAITELASLEPVDALRHVGMQPDDFSGTVTGNVKAGIPIIGKVDRADLKWLVSLDFKDLALAPPVEGQKITGAAGTLVVDTETAVVKAKARLNGAPAELDIVEPIRQGSTVERKRGIAIALDDKARKLLAPGLESLLSGTMKVAFDAAAKETQRIEADLTDAKLDISWVGWSKGAGVPATVSFAMSKDGNTTRLSDFELSGKSFGLKGEVTLAKGALSSASFDTVRLNRGDDVALSIKRSGKGYAVSIKGKALDARSIIKRYLSDEGTQGGGSGGDTTALSVNVDVDRVSGFHDETLSGVRIELTAAGDTVTQATATAVSAKGGAVSIRQTAEGGRRTLEMQTADGGSVLRFLDIYSHMEGGTVRLALAGAKGELSGQADVSNFYVVNEPKLASVVGTTPPGDDRSLNDAVRGEIDTQRVQFQRGYAVIHKRPNYLGLENGILRGPSIGASFQGTLYDEKDNMDMTGTFMPAYGLNRIFGELPLVGIILGNGRDRGLIGVTFRLSGDADDPKLQVNPLSVIAPGIFRQIFEFR